jgi:threonine synthase
MHMVDFISTRGAAGAVSAAEALLRGIAPDGGLYVPRTIPSIPEHLFEEAGSIGDIGADVLPFWFGGTLSDLDLAEVAHDALDFPVPLVALNGAWKGVHVLELFHGPTLSFKDFGARTMARLMARLLPSDQRLNILVATSGDTGSAVADGFAGQANIDVVLLYPKGQVSAVQEKQLIVRRPGVRSLAVNGTFDDCQRLVKEAFASPALRGANLSSANSINIGRLLPQMLYYIEALRTGRFETPPVFCVPSGNLGNLSAGVLAHLAGMPAHGFIAAHNANDFFPVYLSRGLDAYRDSVRTYSNAMDVGVPSNFERLRFFLEPGPMRGLITADTVTDDATLQSMRRVHDETGYVADPHTAVGLEVVRRQRSHEHPIVVLATAHPAKFPDIVEQALGFQPTVPNTLARLLSAETAVQAIEPNLEALARHLKGR